ncbi:hypothetical protein EV385_6665 [Krasilnikovia cinnamomea]|uniref:Uncharacterized protein n=1 Tax=Krasilnikovia cinnamomea TaxID=349313 RepID=A0A4Q7Z7Z4_9ACTN|nr:hypothetical protein [Krasilnikovia cinnamomea]RZU46590.1 hypothetical protein EV385_6665 [Krasilnikovia cinnamomea]
MTTHDELAAAMAQQDFTNGEIVTEPRGSAVFSFRAPAEWNEEILAEMQRRGLSKPGQLLKALVREALDRATANTDQVVTIRLDDLHRAIESVARPAA